MFIFTACDSGTPRSTLGLDGRVLLLQKKTPLRVKSPMYCVRTKVKVMIEKKKAEKINTRYEIIVGTYLYTTM